MGFKDKTPALVSVSFANYSKGTRFRATADTGSSISLIDQRLLRNHCPGLDITPCSLIGVKGLGGDTAISGYVILDIIFKDDHGRLIMLPIKLYVNPAEDSRILLGNDFMDLNGVTINISKRHMTLDRGCALAPVTIPITYKRDTNINMRIADTYTLRAGHVARVPVQVHGEINTSDFFMEPVPIRRRFGVAVAAAKTVGTVTSDVQFVEVYILESKSITLRAGEVVGQIYPLVSSDDIDTIVNHLPEDFDCNKDLLDFRAILDNLDINPALSPDERAKLIDVLEKHRLAFTYSERPLVCSTEAEIPTGNAPPVSTPPSVFPRRPGIYGQRSSTTAIEQRNRSCKLSMGSKRDIDQTTQ